MFTEENNLTERWNLYLIYKKHKGFPQVQPTEFLTKKFPKLLILKMFYYLLWL